MNTSMTTPQQEHRARIFVFFPAVAMLLGWGLRGYIGGGPFGALIPGCFVALTLCLLLGYRTETAAIAALCGAVGIGYGGDMTYGQTLGFLRETDTVWRGLLGCLVKGGVWGLLGGAVLGLGLARDRYDRKTLTLGLLITMLAFYLGWKLVNEPKLIYFSNPVNKPRDESWAGLLFAAVALLAFLRIRGSREESTIPFRFAFWGMLGGAAGFAGGALWMIFGPSIPIEQKWIGWWKAMEFSFGFILGAALGWCAYLSREQLRAAGQTGDAPPATWKPMLGFVAFLIAIFVSEVLLEHVLPDGLKESRSLGVLILRDLFRMLYAFIVFGGAAIILGLRSRHAAWFVAITLAFFHTVLDFVRDLSDTDKFGYAIPADAQIAILLVLTMAAGAIVYRFQRGPNAIPRLYLFILWACYGVATARTFLVKDYLFPPEGESALSMVVQRHPTCFFHFGVFTISAILTTVCIVYCSRGIKEREQVEG